MNIGWKGYKPFGRGDYRLGWNVIIHEGDSKKAVIVGRSPALMWIPVFGLRFLQHELTHLRGESHHEHFCGMAKRFSCLSKRHYSDGSRSAAQQLRRTGQVDW